jgi:hypothetical protein
MISTRQRVHPQLISEQTPDWLTVSLSGQLSNTFIQRALRAAKQPARPLMLVRLSSGVVEAYQLPVGCRRCCWGSHETRVLGMILSHRAALRLENRHEHHSTLA